MALFTVESEAGSLTSEVQELGDMAHHHMDLRRDGDPQLLVGSGELPDGLLVPAFEVR